MSKKSFSRREFLQSTAGTAGAAGSGSEHLSQAGIHSFGALKRWHRATGCASALSASECRARACSRTPFNCPEWNAWRRATYTMGGICLLEEIVGKNIPVTRRYHELLENKDIDCLIAAVPDHWHKQVVIDAVSAGKDIYCEKPMSHTAEDGLAMVAAAKKTDRIVQIGSQRVSSVICAKAKELLAQGIIGR